MSIPARKVIRLRDPAQVDLQPLEQDSRFQKVREELVAIETRIAQSERRRRIAVARIRGQQSMRPAEARAKDLVAGGSVIVMPPDAEMEAADEELVILHRARLAKCEELQRLRSEISLEVCKRFASTMDDSHRAALSALTDLHQALEVGRVIRGRLIAGGFELNESGLPTPYFHGAAALSIPGDPEGSMTPARGLRDWLSARGLI